MSKIILQICVLIVIINLNLPFFSCSSSSSPTSIECCTSTTENVGAPQTEHQRPQLWNLSSSSSSNAQYPTIYFPDSGNQSSASVLLSFGCSTINCYSKCCPVISIGRGSENEPLFGYSTQLFVYNFTRSYRRLECECFKCINSTTTKVS